MKHFVLFVVACCICSTAAYANDTSEIEKVFEDHLKATSSEDMVALKRTAVITRSQEKEILRLWDKYDCSVTPGSIVVLDVDGDAAMARVKVITMKCKGPAFKDNCVTALYFFQRINGKWMLTETEIEDVVYFDSSKAKDGIIDRKFIYGK